jgi:hypothetical protein
MPHPAGRMPAGTRYGRLVIVKRHYAGPGAGKRDGRGEVEWECVCDCGTEMVAKGTLLRQGKVKSCGCLRRDKGKGKADETR